MYGKVSVLINCRQNREYQADQHHTEPIDRTINERKEQTC